MRYSEPRWLTLLFFGQLEALLHCFVSRLPEGKKAPLTVGILQCGGVTAE